MVLTTHGMIPEYRYASQFLIVDHFPVTAYQELQIGARVFLLLCGETHCEQGD